MPELTAAQFKFKVRDLMSNSSTPKEIIVNIAMIK